MRSDLEVKQVVHIVYRLHFGEMSKQAFMVLVAMVVMATAKLYFRSVQ